MFSAKVFVVEKPLFGCTPDSPFCPLFAFVFCTHHFSPVVVQSVGPPSKSHFATSPNVTELDAVTVCVVFAIFFPLPPRPIHPSFIEIMPDWVVWLKANDTKLMPAMFAVYAPVFSALAVQAWGDIRK